MTGPPPMRRCRSRVPAAVIAAVLLFAGCAGRPDAGADPAVAADDPAVTGDGGDGAPPAAPATEAGAGGGGGTPGPAMGSDVPADGDGPSVELVTLSTDPMVTGAQYPRPGYAGDPWSQWGQGTVLDDGRVITAIGDHLGVDGNAYLFVHDPDAGTLTRFGDVLGALDHRAGSWGYGKVHSPMVRGDDGSVYFTTYYGTRRGLAFDDSYRGDVLFRIDPDDLSRRAVAVPVPGHGVPSLAAGPAGALYGEAVDPLLGPDEYPAGGLFVFDPATGLTTTMVTEPDHTVFRTIAVGLDGAAWFARTGGGMYRYDPVEGEATATEVDLGAELRATTGPTASGVIYGATQDPPRLFAFEPSSASVRFLGEAEDYVASVALLPDESGFLYLPGAHGDAHRYGAPLVAVDGADGARTTVVELADLVADEWGLVVGGTYSITVDPDRNVAHIGLNAGTDPDDPWGEIIFVTVELP
ncbi:MAG: hypothetical protein ACK5PP_07185 [Acidimicrobiales bacterium]